MGSAVAYDVFFLNLRVWNNYKSFWFFQPENFTDIRLCRKSFGNVWNYSLGKTCYSAPGAVDL